jgi:hypothetical protein
MPKRPYPRYQRRHHAILLSVCRDPSKKQKEIAKETGYSESHVSRILCSPDFQEIYEKRHHYMLRTIVRGGKLRKRGRGGREFCSFAIHK